MELPDHMVVLFLIFEGTSVLFSIVALPIYIPTNSVRGFPFFLTFSSVCYLLLLDSYSDWCEVVILHCGLIYISLIISNVEHLFMCLEPFWLGWDLKLTVSALWVLSGVLPWLPLLLDFSVTPSPRQHLPFIWLSPLSLWFSSLRLIPALAVGISLPHDISPLEKKITEMTTGWHS